MHLILIPDEPKTITVRVNSDEVPENHGNPEDPQYVYLHASCQDAALSFDEGTPILLSYKAGCVFVQTDKPIYTPRQSGMYRTGVLVLQALAIRAGNFKKYTNLKMI